MIDSKELMRDHTGNSYNYGQEEEEEDRWSGTVFGGNDDEKEEKKDSGISREDLLKDQRDKRQERRKERRKEERDRRKKEQEKENKKKIDDFLKDIKKRGQDKKNKNVKNVEKVKTDDYSEVVKYDNMLNGFDPDNPADKTKDKLEEEIKNRYPATDKDPFDFDFDDPSGLEEEKVNKKDGYQYTDYEHARKEHRLELDDIKQDNRLPGQKDPEQINQDRWNAKQDYINQKIKDSREIRKSYKQKSFVGDFLVPSIKNPGGIIDYGLNYFTKDTYGPGYDKVKNTKDRYFDTSVDEWADTDLPGEFSYNEGNNDQNNFSDYNGGGSTPGTNPKPDDNTGKDPGTEDGSGKDPGTDNGSGKDPGTDDGSGKDPGTDDGSGNPIVDIFDTIGGWFTGDNKGQAGSSGSETSNIITVEGGKDGEGFNIQALAKKYSPLIIAIVLYFVYSYGGE